MRKDDSAKLVRKIRELEKELADLKGYCSVQIHANLSKYKRVIDSTSEGYLELDKKQKVVDCNAAILSLLEQKKESLLGRRLDSFYDKKSIVVHFASRNHLSFEANFRAEHDHYLPLLCKRSIIHDGSGNTLGYLVLLTDLTESKKAQENLQEAQARYRLMYENAVQGMYQSTLDGTLLRVNPALAETFGFSDTEQMLKFPGGVSSFYKNPDDRQGLITLLRKKKVIRNFEVELIRPNGSTIWALINARLGHDELGRTIIEGILIDNTKKRYAEDKLRVSRERFRYLANHDNLTNLYNTRYLYKALDELIIKSDEDGEPFSLVFLDMDNFKHVVDTYGHLNGSQALKEVAKTLRDSLVEPAFGVAYGGDEFVLVLPGQDRGQAILHVEQIRTRMKQTRYLKNKGLAVRMSASFGIATYPDDADDREGLLALADEAMFRVKARGKDAIGATG